MDIPCSPAIAEGQLSLALFCFFAGELSSIPCPFFPGFPGDFPFLGVFSRLAAGLGRYRAKNLRVPWP